MAFSKITKDMNIIAALDDEPNDVGGLSAAQLKAKFDEGGLALKAAHNDHIDDLAKSTAAANIGAKDLNGEPTDVQGAIDAVAVAIIGEIPDGGITTAKLRNGAVTNAKLADPAQNLVGSIAQSVRTDLGDKWALANGDPYDPEEYPEFAAIWPKSIVPKDNPYQTDFGTNVFQLYNGGFASDTTDNIIVSTSKGEYIGTCAVTDITSTSGAAICGFENDGSRYVVAVKVGNTTVYLYTTTDLEHYTMVRQVELASVSSSYTTSGVGLKYDGTYYYLVRYVGPTNIAVFNNSLALVDEVSIQANIKLRTCAHRTYALWFYSENQVDYVGIKLLNGSVPTSLSSYRTVAFNQYNIGSAQIIEFNSTYDALVSQKGLFLIPLDGTSAIQAMTTPFSNAAISFLDGTGTKLIVVPTLSSTSSGYYLPIDAVDPTQSSAWVSMGSLGDFSNASYFAISDYRYKETCMVMKTYMLRAPFLPTFASSGYYTYIKVKE